jgi:ribosomal protein L11 methyltransferase
VLALMERVFADAPSSYINERTRSCKVSVHLERAPGPDSGWRRELLAGLRALKSCGLDTGSARVTVRRLAAQDWAESWKRHFKPLAIGRKLLIQPGWSRRRPRPGQALVVLDPGLSFGTGQHPTTEFCLRQIVVARREGTRQSLLDAGCGSGILSIAAVKLGYGPVRGFDFDPVAVRVAEENARRNRVAPGFKVADLARLPKHAPEQFDVVCANILHDLLTAESAALMARLKPGGLLVLAGILRRHFPPVRRHYEKLGLKLVATTKKKEWQSGAFRAD